MDGFIGNLTTILGRLKNDFRIVYYDHPNRDLHILITVLLLMLILDFIRSIDMRIRLNNMDRCNTALLLSLQEKLIKNKQDIADMNIHNMENHKCLSRKLYLIHSRLKTIYVDLSPRKPRRAPRNDEEAHIEMECRNIALSRMSETDFNKVEK